MKENKGEYPVTITFRHQEGLSRLTTFLRLLMVMPHWIALWAIGIAVSVVRFIAWWAILFTARYPQWAFNFVAGYVRWYTRVMAYYCLLTDRYPPFSMQ